jgi:chromosome segregation ATPase
MNEIESISKAFMELEAAHSQQVSSISDKDEQISRLIADKTKLEQKLTIVHREKDMVSNKVHVLNRQGQKSQEYISKLESDVKAKEGLLEAMSKELAQARTLLSVHERKAQEAFQLAEELTAKQDKVSQRYHEFTSILKQKEISLEQARQAVRKLEEEKLKLENKIKHQNRRLQSNIYAAIAASDPKGASDMATISGSPENIREQLESLKDWKKIAQCSVCEFRIKSHVINRCMHVFCKECLDVRIETRQRKCPQCGGSFGPNDIKQIYI